MSLFVFLIGFIAAPFSVTGWYRVGFTFDPFVLEMAAPFVLVTVGAGYIYLRTRQRSLAAGLGAGSHMGAFPDVALRRMEQRSRHSLSRPI